MANWLESADHHLASLLAGWSILTTILALVIVAFVLYPVLYPDEPDTHPLLLARQSSVSPIRNKGESAVYRSPEVPHGYPLKSGLNVKGPGAPRWAAGKDGDVRDIWREVLKGGSKGEEGKDIAKGSIMTIMGREELIDHSLEELTKEINVLGKHFKDTGVRKVAIYLPNSVDYLTTIFACAFYGLTPVLLPYNQPHPKVYDLINATDADGLVCAAGSLPLDDLANSCQGLHLLTWMVEKTSRHMDWNGVPDAAANRLKVNVWHDVVEENKSTTAASLPVDDAAAKPADLITVWQGADAQSKPDIVTFTQANIVAATAALISALPLRQRFTPSDLVLPADSFTHTYVLCQTFAALYTHASLAINSVAGSGVDLHLASRSVSPTVVIASAETMAAMHEKESKNVTSIPQKLSKYTSNRSLAAGRMPTDSTIIKLLGPASNAIGNEPGRLRLILVSERVGAGTPALSSAQLSDLRIAIRSRIVYALTAAKVAGAVAQTGVFDYRREERGAYSHFGIPVSAVEVKLVGGEEEELGSAQPKGEIVVTGPAVAGGEVRLGAKGRIREDTTLAYV
ncbi:AMP-extracellular domain-containing protein [Teratosphaeria nubilosa]|uniref:AMP-extracellular domain-containing protein n=1 Tax=Teratosphaeria nubilosa TaxID=161662 RepID=A0A6G1L802_9PEZI|nr:AMP-extracellular domain-containing protein [Teratosphaeria nubilosa]